MFCMNCGAELPDGAHFCAICGKKIAIKENSVPSHADEDASKSSLPQAAYDSIEFTIHGEKLSVDGTYRNYISERNLFFKKYFDYMYEFSDQQQDIFEKCIEANPDQCMDVLYNFGRTVMDWSLDAGVEFLIEHGIYDISKALLANECVEKIAGFWTAGFLDEYNGFEEGYFSIIASEEQMKEYRNMKHNTRGKWQGGGFGVAGAVKGAAIAGAFNVGSGILSSISNSIMGAIDSSTIKKQKKDYLNGEPWILRCESTLTDDIYDLFDEVYRFLAERTDIEMPPQNIEQAKAYFENVSKAKNAQQALSIILMGLKECPCFEYGYVLLIDSTPFLDMEVIKVIEYFLPEGAWEFAQTEYSRQVAKKFNDLPSSDDAQIETKISFLQSKIDIVEEYQEQSELVNEFADLYLDDWKAACEELMELRLTATDGTVCPDVETLDAYECELEKFNEYDERAKKATVLSEKKLIWEEAQSTGFTFDQFHEKIETSLKSIQEAQSNVLETYMKKAQAYSNPLDLLSFWKVMQLDLENRNDASPEICSMVQKQFAEAVHKYNVFRGGTIDQSHGISKEELISMMRIVVKESKDRGLPYSHVHVAGGNHYIQKIFMSACKKIGGNNPDEIPLIVIDRSDFENGTRGFVITNKHIYKNYYEKLCLSWNDIRGFESCDNGDVNALTKKGKTCIDTVHTFILGENSVAGMVFFLQMCLKVIRTYCIGQS